MKQVAKRVQVVVVFGIRNAGPTGFAVTVIFSFTILFWVYLSTL
jgi:hypothetical protein